MADATDVLDVLRFYPQIYLACHVDHVRAASTDWHLSARDSSILAHLDISVPTSPRQLARHLGVQPSTLSAAVARLEQLGYVTTTTATADKRRRELRLSARGAEAMAGTSVLDRNRVADLLGRLSPQERSAAVHGLSLLARAARELKKNNEEGV